MKYSDESILGFLGSLQTGDVQKVVEYVNDIDETVSEIYEQQEKEEKAAKKEARLEKNHKRRLAQMAKRKEKKGNGGFFSKLFGKKEKKEAEMIERDKQKMLNTIQKATGSYSYRDGSNRFDGCY